MVDAEPILPFPLTREGIVPFVGACFHPARSSGQADVYAMTGGADDWVLKDFSRRPWWMRVLVNRRALRREARALEGLQGLPGLPRIAGVIGRDALLIERLYADRLPHREEAAPSALFFERLNALVAEMHRRGWSHGDLRRKNILLDPSEQPYLIDFATAVHCPSNAGLLRRWIFERLLEVDRINLARIKESYRPEDLTDAERQLVERQPWHWRVGHWFRKNVYRPLKPRHRRETWERIRARLGLGRP
jgi:predicted Ser/Thr protein kinase